MQGLISSTTSTAANFLGMIRMLRRTWKAAKLAERNQLEEAESNARKAIELCDRLSLPSIKKSKIRSELLATLARILDDLYDFEGAEATYLDSISEMRTVVAANEFPDAKAKLATQLSNFGNTLTGTKQINKAKAAYSEAIEIRKDLVTAYGDVFSHELALSLSAYGRLLIENFELESGKRSIKEGLSVLDTFPGSGRDHLEALASLLHSLANAESELGDLENSISHTKRTIEIREQLGDRNELAQSYQQLGYLAERSGDYDLAISATTKAADLMRELALVSPRGYEPALASCLSNLGNMHFKVGADAGADAAYQECITLRRSLAEEMPNVHANDFASTLSNVGIFKKDHGELTEAIELLEESRSCFQSLGGKVDSAMWSRLLHNLGTTYCELSRFEDGRVALSEAERIRKHLYEEAPSVFAFRYALTLGNLAMAYSTIGAHEEASGVFEQATGIFRVLAPANVDDAKSHLAQCLTNYGNTLSAIKKSSAAREAYSESVEIYESFEMEDHARCERPYANALHNLASLNAEEGALELAAEQFTNALKIRKQLGSEKKEDVAAIASTQHGLGKLSLELGRFDDGLQRLTAAAHTFENLVLQEPEGWLEDCLYVFRDLGVAYSQFYHDQKEASLLSLAIKWLEAGLNVGEKLRFRFLAPAERRRITESVLHPLAQELIDCYAMKIVSGQGATEAIRQAVATSEKFRARATVDLIESQRLPRNTPPEISKQYQKLRADLMNCAQLLQEARQRQRSGLSVSMPEAGGMTSSEQRELNLSRSVEPIRDRYFAATERYNKVVKFIQKTYDPDFDPDSKSDDFSLELLQSVLTGTKREIVQLSTTRRATYAAVVSARGIKWVVAEQLAEDELTAVGEEWFSNLRESIESHQLENLVDRTQGVVSKLSRQLIEPIYETIDKETDSLTFVTNRFTSGYPLGICEYGGRRICDQQAISVTHCLGTWLIQHRPQNSNHQGTKTLVSQLDRDIPFGELELESAAKQSLGLEVKKLKLDDLDQLKESIRVSKIWHYCGHAEFDRQVPLESRLGKDSLGGTVSVRDIATQFDCASVEVVFLSACQSGLFLPDRLNEYIGVVPAFITKGATNVIGSLWDAEDLPTWLFADRFYFNLENGCNIDLAFAEAQKWLRGVKDWRNECLSNYQALVSHMRVLEASGVFKQSLFSECFEETELWEPENETPPFENPSYWASFVLTKSGV